MKGIDLHSLPLRDAALVALTFMETLYPDDTKRMAEYRKLAASLGIEVEEDPALARERHRREMAKVEAEFGGGLA